MTRFSVGTLVTNHAQYEQMRSSFVERGFGDAEFLIIDNATSNSVCAYRGISQLLDRATGDYLVMCHQDVLLLDDDAARLESLLDELPSDWAIAGNAGIRFGGDLAVRISDPHGANRVSGPFPAKVQSLDENFLVVRRSSGLRPSARLSGFHLYGTDLCLQAEAAGFSSYVIDFHLRHLSGGKMDDAFFKSQREFELHWGALLGARSIRTNSSILNLRAGPYSSMLARWKLARRRGESLPRAALAMISGDARRV